MQEGIDRMLSDEKFVFVWDEDSVGFLVEDPCSLQSVKLKERQMVFYVKKDFPYSGVFNKQ